MGGYQRRQLPDSEADYMANIVFQQWVLMEPQLGCNTEGAVLTVLDACTQVVAGTNWYLLLTSSCPCGNEAQPEEVLLEGLTFQPLPYTNQLPQVLDVKQVG